MIEVVSTAVSSGVRWVQYREKQRSRLERYAEARQLRQVTRQAGAFLMVNDELDLAVAVEADGVHLGQDDLTLSLARRHIGRGRLIGLSTHSVKEARQAEADGSDYIGVGPVFSTSTKPGRVPVGVEMIQQVCTAVSLPVEAIGGITPDNLGPVFRAGASAVAVISALCGATHLPQVIAQFQSAIDQAR